MAGLVLLTTAGVAVGSAIMARRWRRESRQLADEVDALRVAQTTLSAELTTAQTHLDTNTPNVAGVLTLDRLEAITGLTPHHARLLNAAGILTYNDLATLTADDIHLLTADAGGARMDVTRWIVQARQFAEQCDGVQA